MRKIIDFDASADNATTNPILLYEEIHRNNSVLRDPRLCAMFFGRHKDVRFILTSDEFTTAPLENRAQPVMGDRVLAQMEGKEHHTKRRAILSKLSARYFRDHYASIISTLTRDLLTPRIPSGKIDLVNEFGKDYGVLTTLLVLGLPTERHSDVSCWQAGITKFITSLELSADEKTHCLDCSAKLINYLEPIIADRMHLPDDGLISALCGARGEQSITLSEVTALVLNILLAATEPADKTLAYLFYNLLSDSTAMERITADRTLLPAAINETLRLTPPVQLIPRQARQDTDLAGLRIRKGTLVYCMIGAANRDPDVFPQPSRFIMDRRRSPNEGAHAARVPNHLAFGTGAHACVGAAFSLMQTELTAATIIKTLGPMKLPDEFKIMESGFYTRGPVSLPITFTPAPHPERCGEDMHHGSNP